MSRYSELKEQLLSLPKGYLSKKSIQGKLRYYLQFRDGKKIVSRYVKASELEQLKTELEKRKQIEKELEKLLISAKEIRKLSNNVLSLTGDVMEGDDVVASFKNDELTYIDEKRAPSLIVKNKLLSPWLAKRSIDNHRTNSRLLRKALRIKEANEINNVIRVNAVCLTDDYWFRPSRSILKYKDVIFNNDYFSETALNGDLINIPSRPFITPELTNTGSYEKCWKLINGEWYMFKKGNKKEIFAELFCSLLAEKLKIPTIVYRLHQGYIISKNFASSLNLEPISAFAGDDDSYENVFAAVKKINEAFLEQYLLLIYFDALVDNVDRHNENIALLRERKSGRFLYLAPNYDNNLALYSLEETSNRNSFGLIKEFEKFIRKNKEAETLFLSLKLPDITKELLTKTLNEIEESYRILQVVDFVFTRYQELSNFRNELSKNR